MFFTHFLYVLFFIAFIKHILVEVNFVRFITTFISGRFRWLATLLRLRNVIIWNRCNSIQTIYLAIVSTIWFICIYIRFRTDFTHIKSFSFVWILSKNLFCYIVTCILRKKIIITFYCHLPSCHTLISIISTFLTQNFENWNWITVLLIKNNLNSWSLSRSWTSWRDRQLTWLYCCISRYCLSCCCEILSYEKWNLFFVQINITFISNCLLLLASLYTFVALKVVFKFGHIKVWFFLWNNSREWNPWLDCT